MANAFDSIPTDGPTYGDVQAKSKANAFDSIPTEGPTYGQMQNFVPESHEGYSAYARNFVDSATLGGASRLNGLINELLHSDDPNAYETGKQLWNSSTQYDRSNHPYSSLAGSASADVGTALLPAGMARAAMAPGAARSIVGGLLPTMAAGATRNVMSGSDLTDTTGDLERGAKGAGEGAIGYGVAKMVPSIANGLGERALGYVTTQQAPQWVNQAIGGLEMLAAPTAEYLLPAPLSNFIDQHVNKGALAGGIAAGILSGRSPSSLGALASDPNIKATIASIAAGPQSRTSSNDSKGPLGLALNNPGNLRYAGQPGAVAGQSGFAQFPSMEAGISALQRQIQLDQSRNETLSQFISKYAPPSENDTSTYTKQATQALGVSPTTNLAAIPVDQLSKFIASKETGFR